jgi:hypothetical protein
MGLKRRLIFNKLYVVGGREHVHDFSAILHTAPYPSFLSLSFFQVSAPTHAHILTCSSFAAIVTS